MPGISDQLDAVRARMVTACLKAGRSPSDVELIAVSKTFPACDILEAVESGQRVFGESRLQEAEPKIDVLPGSLHWHFIGRVQRNKVRRILSRFEVIHAIDSTRLALYADEIARELGLFPKAFLQVNIGGEMTKGGFEPDAIREEIECLLALERLEVIGLMCIPPPAPDHESSRPWFRELRQLRDVLQERTGALLPALSMGMSDDFAVAIEEGATHVRVGSSIFGKRAYQVDGELG